MPGLYIIMVAGPNKLLYQCIQYIPVIGGKYSLLFCNRNIWICISRLHFSKANAKSLPLCAMPYNICPKGKEIKCWLFNAMIQEYLTEEKHWIFHALPSSALITVKYKLIQVIIFIYKPRHINWNASSTMSKEWFTSVLRALFIFPTLTPSCLFSPTWLIFVQGYALGLI